MILAHCRNTVMPTLFPRGAQALRLWDGGTRMALLNPASGQFAWDRLDTHLAAAEAAGLKSIYTFGSTPAWAAIPTTGQPGIIDATSNRPMDPVALGAFVDALMARYGARIWALETWNEWNAPGFWIGSLSQLAVQQYIIYTHAKRANPNVIITTPTPCLAPKCQFSTADASLAAFAPEGMPFDAVTFHGYAPAGTPPGPAAVATIQAMRAVMAQFGINAPLWDTEFGPGPASGFATADAQRLWLFDSYIARHQAGLDLACWYQWDNQTHGACVDLNGNLTPLGRAWADYISMIGAA